MKNVSVGVKTFLRPQALASCLEALRAFDFAKVIVADDNPHSVSKAYNEVYTRYKELLPLQVQKLPFDTGLAASRNHIVAAVTTNYVLILDDDQVVNNTLPLMYDVLTSRSDIGGVSCFFNEQTKVQCSACNIYTEDNYIVKELREQPQMHTTGRGTQYALFEFIPSSTLFHRKCLTDVRWDPFYKIGAEHLDFYLQQKRLGKWKFAVALDASVDHFSSDHEEVNETNYNIHRHGLKLDRSWEYFNKKFNVLGKIEGKKYSDVLHTEP